MEKRAPEMASEREGLTAAERAAEYGVDLSLLESRLRMTPEERLQAHDRALELVRELQRANQQFYGNGRTNPKAR